MPIRLLASLVLVVVIGYGFVKAWPLLRGPELRLTTPTTGSVSTDGFITISGTALHTQSLALDGGPLLIDESGHFETTILAPRGDVILTLIATDRFGRSTSRRPDVVVE